jgi:tetratricopeptide (TPR) repeat protein
VERYRLFQAVGSWLSVGGTDSPRLLVLDDLHWADKPTLLLLRHLISNPPTGLMILCTYRDTDVDRTHPLSSMLADFRRMPAVDRIALDGLGDSGVRELLTRTGGHELDEDGLAFAEVVQRETSGNPFFLGEVLRHLAETGALYERDGRWVSDLRPEEAGIPEGIREVVGRRLSRLGDDVEIVLRSAAVIGYEFDVDLLADVVDRDADDVLDALDIATRANLVIEVGVDRHRFAHALVRETLHGELSSSRRARQHRRVAEALEARHADDRDAVVAELATHWAEASAGGDPTRAIELAIRAGDLAADRGAFENAVRWFEQALELMEDEGTSSFDRRRTFVRLAAVQIYTGAGAEARDNAMAAARASIAAGDLSTACEAMAVSPRASFDSSDPPDPERTALLREVLAFDDLTSTQRAHMLGQLATELIFERDIEGRAAALAEFRTLTTGLPALDQVQLRNPGLTSYRAVGRREATALLDILVEAARLVPRPSLRMHYLRGVCFCSYQAGDRDVLDRALSQLVLPAGPNANFGEVFTLLPITMRLTVSGDLEAAAIRRVELVDGMTSLGSPEATVYETTTMLALARETGTLADLGIIADLTEQIGHPAGAARALSAYIRFAQNDVDRVMMALDLISTEELADDAGYPIVVGYWSEIVAGLQITGQCRRFIAELEPLAGTHLATGGIHLGSADRYRALLHDALGEHDVADELFAAAVEQHEAFRTPPWLARTHLDWTESLIARSRFDDARTHLDAARAAIGDLDLPDSQRRLDTLNSRL